MQSSQAQNERENGGKRIINFRTLLFCALFLCFGIIFAYLHVIYGLSLWYACILLPITGVICVLAFTLAQWKRILVSLALLALSFILGAVCFSAQINDFQSGGSYDGERTVGGRVIAKETDGETYALTLDSLSVDGNQEDGKLTAYLPASCYEETSLSDEVLLFGDLRTKTQTFGDYGFRAYAVEENMRYVMYVEETAVVGKDFHLFLATRGILEDRVCAGMDETPAAVTVATLIGNTSGIEEGLLDNVRRGGIAHIFAVSGLHVGALYAFCLWLIGKTGLKRTAKTIRFVIVFAVLLLYGGICGYSASVVRATVMCLLLYFSKLAGLGNDNLETISAAAIIVLLISPVSLFTVGFQLSFAACYGIALLARPISKGLYRLGDFIRYNVLRKERKPFVLEEDTHPLNTWQRIVRATVSFASVTLAAQIATTPIQICSFGYLSVWSLLLNCIFVPIVSALFSVLLAFVVVASILPSFCGAFVLFIPNAVWSAMLLVFENVTFSTVSLAVSPVAVCTYYASATLCCGKWNLPKKAIAALSLAFALVCTVSLVFTNV